MSPHSIGKVTITTTGSTTTWSLVVNQLTPGEHTFGITEPDFSSRGGLGVVSPNTRGHGTTTGTFSAGALAWIQTALSEGSVFFIDSGLGVLY